MRPPVVIVAMVATLAGSAPALAQPARVTALVTRPGDGRDIAVTNAAVQESAQRLLARCEPAGRAAQPLDEQYFTLAVDAEGRVTRVTRPPVPTEALDLTQVPAGMRRVTRAERARAARFISCVARLLPRLRFPPGPAAQIELHVAWQEPGPPAGLLGILRSP